MRRERWAGAGAAGLLVIIVALSPHWGAAATSQTVRLKAFEFAFEPKSITVPTGETVFEVTNTGSIEHSFLIDDPTKKQGAKIAVISPGQTEQVTVTLRAGAHTIYCDLPGHREAGMVATLRVQP